MKLQLFLKASKAYYVLSDAATNLLKYGRALRYIKLSMQCYGKAVGGGEKRLFNTRINVFIWLKPSKMKIVYCTSDAIFCGLIFKCIITASASYKLSMFLCSCLPTLFAPDAYCSVSSTLHPQVLYFHSQCLSLCGDIQLMLAQNANNRAAYLEEYSYQTKEDQEILHSLHRESSCQGGYLGRDKHRDLKARNTFFSSFLYARVFTPYPLAFNMATDLATDPEYQLFVSIKCYEAAYELLVSDALKDHSPDQLAQVLKRLGNIRNEMGVYYMNQAAAMQTEKEGRWCAEQQTQLPVAM